MATTLLESIQTSILRAARHNPSDTVAPAAVLWTDADRQWEPVAEQLRRLMPELLTLGSCDPEARSGPAIWLRCVIEPAVRSERFPELKWPAEAVPVIYMPGVSRQTLRSVEDCPEELKPLVELQYRGTVWTQRNGKDWTVRAFLVSDDGGLGLDVAEDAKTLQAMLGALERLAMTPIARLQGRRLEAEDFDKLMIGDTAGDLLRWLNDAQGVRERWDDAIWAAFCGLCRQDYDFDPEEDGEFVGGERLGKREGAWLGVWQRFVESPASYPGVPDLLRRAQPKAAFDLFTDPEPWPAENERMEDELRTALKKVGALGPAEARARLAELESTHGQRRAWVWARMGLAPLAQTLEHLALLSSRTASSVGGDSADAMVRLYVEGGYLADDAVLRALACVKTARDTEVVGEAVRSVYLPWLDDSARALQACIASKALPSRDEGQPVVASPRECIVFADGLRFDVGRRLLEMAEARRLEASIAWRWAALPTVTGTAKPAVSPVAGKLRGGRPEADFCPETADGGERMNTDRFRRLLSAEGYQVLTAGEEGDPTADGARAWTEHGELDRLGHSRQRRLAPDIEGQPDLLLDRVEMLLKAGWKRVHVVTDHGWLLVPGGLPKAPLPKYLAESRWSRCASIKDTSHVEVPVAPWFWNPHEYFASGPGAHCFVAGQEYAHGGISLQECVLPTLTFEGKGEAAAAKVVVKELNWVGLRCRVRVEPVTPGAWVQLRLKPGDPASAVSPARPLDDEGKAALVVEDDSLHGAAVSLVVVDNGERVVCRVTSVVGGED